jgi:transcriptional regulator with XRE-family HTH domain
MTVARVSDMTYDIRMSLAAAGAYLQLLRERRGLSRADVASAAGTNEAQVIRIEKGEIDTRGSLLLRMVQAVRGRAEDVLKLVTDASATAEDGRRAAENALRPMEPSAEEKELLERLQHLSPAHRRALMQYLQAIAEETN